jgi:hypothetical protein
VVGVGPRGHAFVDRLVVRNHRYDDDRRARVRLRGADVLEHRHAADTGHQQVEQDRVVGVVLREPDGLLARPRELHFGLEVGRDDAREEQPRRFVVVDDQDAVSRRVFQVTSP